MACVADTFGPTINGRANPPKAESYKTYMGAIALTAPESWGWAKGSTLNLGVVNGFNSTAPPGGAADNQTSWYAGTTIVTPVKGLKVGASFDFADFHNQAPGVGDNQWVVGGYVNYQLTEKLSLNGRGEYFVTAGGAGKDTEIYEATATIQYDLWANVLSRLEFRWDHGDNGPTFGGTVAGQPTERNATMILANLVYKF